jgi:UDP:flavonoid glycosyltransferase YjiC (YdhE family)
VLEAGMILLHKPFTEEVLIRKVREVLDAESIRRAEPKTNQVTGQDRGNPN